MFTRRFFLLATLAGCSAPGEVAMPARTKLIVVRHGEKSGEDLNEIGKARADALVAALSGVHIDAIYSPGIQRNLDTAAPLAASRGIEVQRIPAENPTARLIAKGAGKTIVWVGNKGNIASIWASLGATDPAPLDYGDLFILEHSAFGPPKVTRQHFGL